MAVQAQFPSPLSVLTTRAGRDAVGVSAIAGGYTSPLEPILNFDTSNMFFANGATTTTTTANPNPKKRSAAAMNAFSLSPPAELCLRRPTSVSTGLQLSSEQSQSLAFLWPILKQQSDEIERYLKSQAEEMRRALTETRRRHHRALVAAAEEVVSRRLREKDAVIENVCRQNALLEARAAELSQRAEEWRAVAVAQEAEAVAINEQLQKAVAVAVGGGWSPEKTKEEGGAAGAWSGGGGEEGCVEDAGSEFVDPERGEEEWGERAGPVCRLCECREAVVVLLPCRHLCVCRQCDDVVLHCPLCSSTRTDSMEVLLV